MAQEQKRGGTRPQDPLELWREWLDRFERQTNSMLNDVMSTPEWSKASGRMMEAFLQFQQGMSSSMERHWSTLNIPTRTDLLTLSERLSEIEERLARIEAAVVPAVRDSRSERRQPKRTKKPPSQRGEAAAEVEKKRSKPRKKRKKSASSKKD